MRNRFLVLIATLATFTADAQAATPSEIDPPMFNDNYYSLPDFPFQTSRRTEDLLRGVYTDNLIIRAEATVTITTGGGVSGAVRGTGSIAQLLARTDLNWDGTMLFDLSGVELRKITQLNSAQALSETVLASAADGVYNLTGDYMINFARRDLINPVETNLPPLPVQNQLRVGVEWNTGTTNAASSAGSSSLVTGGTRTVTITNARLQIVQNYSQFGSPSWYIPVLTSVDSTQFLAADPRLQFPLRSNRRFNAVLFHSYQNGDIANDRDMIEYVTFMSGNDRYIDRQDRDVLRAMTRYKYPALNGEVGWLYMPLAAGGKLTNAVDPTTLANPRFEFDVSAPASNPGVVRATFFELIKYSGVTWEPETGNLTP